MTKKASRVVFNSISGRIELWIPAYPYTRFYPLTERNMTRIKASVSKWSESGFKELVIFTR